MKHAFAILLGLVFFAVGIALYCVLMAAVGAPPLVLTGFTPLAGTASLYAAGHLAQFLTGQAVAPKRLYKRFLVFGVIAALYGLIQSAIVR